MNPFFYRKFLTVNFFMKKKDFDKIYFIEYLNFLH